MGNPFLNLSLDGFLKIGTVGALRVAAEESYHCMRTKWCPAPGCDFAVDFVMGSGNYDFVATVHTTSVGIVQRKLTVQWTVALWQCGF
ncbi:hypothetical protein MRB53_025934 [Persea americana]|uniref:Uncharacterized protein n=1 Tax=Persea americana TaxID=3435 RepID=A0ACC2LHF6_PERAE|nr:hypothetical protein MRB53_025934 [Persea americana]